MKSSDYILLMECVRSPSGAIIQPIILYNQ